MRSPFFLLPLLSVLCSPVMADSGRVADTVRQKLISADLASCAKPVWPQESLRREEKGTVTLAFLVGLDGTVLESKVEKSSGFPLLDHAARDGLALCKFTPPAQVGRTQPQWTTMQYVWTLTETDPDKRAAERAKIFADAEQGDAEAQFKAAGIHMTGTQRNPALAVELLRKAAEQGHARAQEVLGFELTYGRNVPSDPAEAESWLRKAASSDAPSAAGAQYGLAVLLLRNGYEEEGTEWLEKSAVQNYAPALAAIGAMLLHKQSDLPRAVAVLQQASDKQNRQAQFLLGQLYEQGKGVPQDRNKALELYERASAGGIDAARLGIARLRSVAQ